MTTWWSRPWHSTGFSLEDIVAKFSGGLGGPLYGLMPDRSRFADPVDHNVRGGGALEGQAVQGETPVQVQGARVGGQGMLARKHNLAVRAQEGGGAAQKASTQSQTV